MNKKTALQFIGNFTPGNCFIDDICSAYGMDIIGDHRKSGEIYNNILSSNNADSFDLIKAGFLLFGAAENIRRSNDKGILDKHLKSIDSIVQASVNTWNKPQGTLFGECEDAVNTSTLGIIYGGLLSINTYLKRDDISLCTRDIKDYVFKNNISISTLVNSSKYKQVTSDLLFSVMPFGMFSPDDLVLFEAVKVMERELCLNGRIKRDINSSSGDLISTLMLSWYFSEKRDFGKSKIYLKAVEDSEIENICEALLYFLVTSKLESTGNIGEVSIDHRPFGNRNRYEPGNNERNPKIPVCEESVEINAVTWPMNSDLEVKLNVSVNGMPVPEKVGKYIENNNGALWQWNIGPFNADDHVEYSFAVKSFNSEVYSFEVVSRISVKNIKSTDFNSGSLIITLNDSKGNLKKIIFTPCENGMLYIGNKEPGFKKSNYADFLDNSEFLKLSFGKSYLRIDKNSSQAVFYDNSRLILKMDFGRLISWYEDRNNKVYKTKCILDICEDEKFYGFGERYNSISQENNTPDCYVYNQYRDQGIRTYIPVPFLISSKGYGMYIDSANYIRYDLGAAESSSYSFEVESSDLGFFIIPGKPKEVTSKFTDITGKPGMLPKWAFGPWMSSNNWDNQNEVIKQVELTKKYDIPSTVLVIEAWSDEATYYIFNDAVYEENDGKDGLKFSNFRFPDFGRWPDPKGMVEYLHKNNLRCILWQIPVIKYMNNMHHIQKDMDEEYAIKNKYCVFNCDGTPYRLPEGWFKGSLILDFSNPAAVTWWFDKREYLLREVGIDGFKTDGGECIFGDDIKFHSGKTGREMRNLYPNEYIESYYKFINKNNPGEKICFSRAGYTGVQRFPAHWAGDENSTFEAFRKSIIAGLTAGMSGISFWGWDIAGFSGDIPTAELYIRASQMAAFCPIMQYHAESKAEFNQDRTPWNIAERTGDIRVIELYRYYAQLRMNLLPYIYNEALKSSITGIPIMRTLFMEYPEDKNCAGIEDEYMFGDDLLVCPVIREGSDKREVYLPEGKWINFYDNRIYGGGRKIEADAPIDVIPVYVKQNSMIAFNLNKEYMVPGKVSGSLYAYDNLCFRLYGDIAENYVFKDDMGNCIYIDIKNEEDINISIKNANVPVTIIMQESGKRVKVNNRSIINFIKIYGGLAVIKVSEVEVYE